MNHLLYSSNEMYSSTELIRKSKTIFNKIINEEIDKAIILRDGKPSFMLLDFDKYEKIMIEYDILKTKESTKSNTKNNTNKKKKKKEKIIKKENKNEIILETKPIVQEKVKKPMPAKIIPPSPKIKDEENIFKEDVIKKSNEKNIIKEELKEFWA